MNNAAEPCVMNLARQATECRLWAHLERWYRRPVRCGASLNRTWRAGLGAEGVFGLGGNWEAPGRVNVVGSISL